MINSDPKINYVLIADMLAPLKLEKDLSKKWVGKIYDKTDKSFLTKITVLHKANYYKYNYHIHEKKIFKFAKLCIDQNRTIVEKKLSIQTLKRKS